MDVLPQVESGTENVTREAGAVSNERAEVKVGLAGGLHARPSAQVQKMAKRFSATVQIAFNGQRANARSTVALMGLGVEENDMVSICASGTDAALAVEAIASVLQSGDDSECAPATPSAPEPENRSLHADSLSASQIPGVCAAPGLAIGQVVVVSFEEPEIAEAASDPRQEEASLRQGVDRVRTEICEQIRQADQRKALHESQIFSAHLALLDDPELLEGALAEIRAGKSAGFSFRHAVRAQCDVLRRSGVALLVERESDLLDLERRVLRHLTGNAQTLPELFEASILIADDLAPSELTRLPRQRIAGIATVRGGATSHLAILARSMGIPALVAVGPRLHELWNGHEVLLDARAGWIDASPEPFELDEARRELSELRSRQSRMLAEAADIASTRDGVRIEVAANIGNVAEALEGVKNGADAVGLTRTEFLFIDRTEAPTVEQQRDVYQSILDSLGHRRAIIRTIDIGGDKEVQYLTLPQEENPALGLRGIRTGIAHPDLLDAQLRALLSVSALERLLIMIPMVTDVGDLQYVRERIESIASELGLQGRPQLGVMIEVPSAALLADQLAEFADFMSIGTNDLSQYTLAMDRCHPGLAARIDALHPGVLRLIALTVEKARRHDRWVGVCGALASDPAAVPVLVGLGVTELSVSPGMIPEIKSKIRSLDAAQCRQEAASILGLSSAQAVRARSRQVWPG
jgi:multiphosphoryl transfer protein